MPEPRHKRFVWHRYTLFTLQESKVLLVDYISHLADVNGWLAVIYKPDRHCVGANSTGLADFCDEHVN
jgi:hypothetical protein